MGRKELYFCYYLVMGLQEAIVNIWSSDYVQKNPNKAYKVTYNAEYFKVADYLNGGPEPNYSNFSKLGKGLCELEKIRRGGGITPPTPQPSNPSFSQVTAVVTS